MIQFRTQRTLVAGIVLLSCVLWGCGGKTKEKSKRLSPVEHFRQNQCGTDTPHSPIICDSVEDLGSGRLRYRTRDGSTFEIDSTPTKHGYRYSNPKRIQEPD